MSHLKCAAHHRRVVVIDGTPLHRSNHAPVACDTKTVISGDSEYLVTSIFFTSTKAKSPGKRLLQDIFRDGKPRKKRKRGK